MAAHAGRLRGVLAAAAALAVLGFAGASTARAAGPQVGYSSENYSAFSVGSPAVTGEKPESKLWYQGGKWWASMVASSHAGAHTIHRLDGTTWTDTGIVVDSRPNVREDALLSGSTLYILVRAVSGQSKLARFTFANSTYQAVSGYPVNVPGGGSETSTLALDGTGKLWLTYTLNNKVYVAHSNSTPTSWTAPYVIPGQADVAPDDISSIISFSDSSGAAIGVMWSNQNDNKQRFAVHRDDRSDQTWSTATALTGTGEVDDHINLKTYNGRVFAVVKTSQNDFGAPPTTPQIKLLVRSTSGTWTEYPVATIAEDNTRPITMLEIDPVDQKLYVFMTLGVTTVAHGVAYKETPLSAIKFPSTAKAFIRGANDEPINNATSMKQNPDNTTGIVVMASDGTKYWWNRIEPRLASGNVTPTAVATQATTLTGIPVTVTLAGTDPDAGNCELQFSNLSTPAHGTLSAPSNEPCQDGSPNRDTATVVYTPTAGYNGSDSFTFRVNDGIATSVGTVTMTMSATPPPPPAGTISFRSSSSAGNASTTSLTIPAPTLAGVGDVELAAIGVRGAPRITPPAGWALVRLDQNANTITQAIYRHQVGASEPSSYTWSWPSAVGASGGIVAYSGVDTANPVNVSGGQTGSGVTAVAPSVTVSTANSMLVGFFSAAAVSSTIPPTGMTERFSNYATAGTYRSTTEGSDQLQTATGATGTRSLAFGVDSDNVAALVALNKAGETPVNLAPSATDAQASTVVSAPVTVTLNGSDPDAGNCELQFSIATQPTHGTLGALTDQPCIAGSPNRDSATVLYTPVAGYSGSDSFTFRVGDGSLTATGTATITVISPPPPPVGSISFRSSSSAGNTSTTSLTIPAPLITEVGDVELAAIAVRGLPTIAAPAGWTLLRSDQNAFSIDQAIFWHVVGSSEPSSYTWSWGSAVGASGGIVVYSGVAASPIGVHGGQVGTGTAAVAPSITTASTGSMLVGFFSTSAVATASAPTGMTQRFTGSATAGTYRTSTAGFDQPLPAAGATGTRSATFTADADNAAAVVALLPAGGGAPNTPPTATDGQATTTANVPVMITLAGSDPDPGDCDLQFLIASQPAHGTLGGVSAQACTSGSPNRDTATVLYTPASGYTGSDSFTVRVADASSSSTATISITVGAALPPNPIAFRSASSAGNASTSSLTIPAPSSTQPGDVELAVVSVRGLPTITQPAGWLLVRFDQNGNSIAQAIYRHVVGAAEPSSYTWTWSAAVGASGGIVAYSGVDTTNPIAVSSGQTGSGASAVAPSLTTTTANGLLVGFFSTSAVATATAPTGMVQRFVSSATAGTYRTASEGSDQQVPAAGATGTRSLTFSVASDNVGALVALANASTAPPSVNLVAAGDIATCDGDGDSKTAALLDFLPGTVAVLGDNAYEAGTAEEYAQCYDPTWGRAKARTKPAVGNHEYETPGATGYFGYFGAAAGDPAKGYYSYDLGAWHVVVLNSSCDEIGGCGTGSPQEQWLHDDLAAHPAACTLAYWHHPRFSSGDHGNDATYDAFWRDLYDAGADLILVGHDHDYERYAPQDPNAVADPARGMREFVVGTGGQTHRPFPTVGANSEVRHEGTFGVLSLRLRATGYDWQFVPVAGGSFTDTGSTACR